MDATKVTIETPPCPRCNDVAEVQVTPAALAKFEAGAYVQDAFPELDADTRERFLTGTCPPCWEALFPPEDDE